ncbi:MAG: ABC transporter substrate-binding protein [Pseudomonadota bacterium]
MSRPTTAPRGLTRRAALAGLGAAATLPGLTRYAQAQSAEPIRIGFQVHRTGIGSVYGRWYDRATRAAAKWINDQGGINGRPVEIVAEDDGTDPRRGAEVVEKFASQHNCDVAFGTLFSDVVQASAPRAGELKLPYFVVSAGFHVPSGALNRWTLQPGITDVRSQIEGVTPFIADNLGRKATMIFPDYAYGHDHRDFFSQAIAAQGGEVIEQIAIPPTETSFLKYFPSIPRQTEVIYHVMVGPGVLSFVKEMGEFFGGSRPEIFGFMASIEGVPLTSPGLDFLEGTYFWEGMPRYRQPDGNPHDPFFREQIGVDETGADLDDPGNVCTYSYAFGCWETLQVIKAAMEACDYRGPQDRQAVVEAVEDMTAFEHSRAHPQGPKVMNGRTHQVFARQHVSLVKERRMDVVHVAEPEETMYPDATDYLQKSF